MRKIYMNDDGSIWTVDDHVDGPAGIKSTPVPWQPNRIFELQFPPGSDLPLPATRTMSAAPATRSSERALAGGEGRGSVTPASLQRPRRR
jgi:hypothetical protein